MLLSKTVKVKWNPKNVKHYKEKGYAFTKFGDEIEVNIKDLTIGSHTIVEVHCDYCNKPIPNLSYKTFLTQRNKNNIKKDCCKKCSKYKVEEVNLDKYGVENAMFIHEIAKKQKTAVFDKFGVENVSQLPEIQELKVKNSLEKYGVPYPSQTKEFREKVKSTNIKRYGFPSAMQNEEVKQRALKTLMENNAVNTSSQQRHLHVLLSGRLNFLVGSSFLDIAYPEEMVYIEYDGGGHDLQVKLGQMTADEFFKKEQRRFYFLRDLGWKEIRIICEDDKLPEDRIIVDFVNRARSFLLQKNKSRNPSVIYNTQTNIVKLNHKKKISLEEFLNDNFKSEKEVS